MRFTLDPPGSGPTNMGQDRELLRQAERGEAVGRLYRWDGPWVSLGQSQDPARDLLPSCPIPWVHRPTGGRAVLHGHDLTVGLAVPLSNLVQEGESVEGLRRSVRRVYRRVVHPVVVALNAAGLDVDLAENTPFVGRRGGDADCFAHVSANDVVDVGSGVKVCGVALRLTESAVLVQASIPAGPPPVDPARVFLEPGPVTYQILDVEAFGAVLPAALRVALLR